MFIFLVVVVLGLGSFILFSLWVWALGAADYIDPTDNMYFYNWYVDKDLFKKHYDVDPKDLNVDLSKITNEALSYRTFYMWKKTPGAGGLRIKFKILHSYKKEYIKKHL